MAYMHSFFTSDFFINNRRTLQATSNDNLLLFTANGSLQRLADTAFPFAQDANFWYLTGLNSPDFILVMHQADEFIILPERSAVQNLFDGSVEEAEVTNISGIKNVLSSKDGWARLRGIFETTSAVASLPANPPYIKQIGMYTNPTRTQLLKKLRRVRPGLEIHSVAETLARQRIIKQPAEIAAIRQAVNITCQGFADVQKQQFSTEYELEAELTKQFRSRGADGHAYDPIIAAAKNACTLHYMDNNDPIKNDDIVLVDAGAQVSHYAADITRSWAANPTPRQKAVIHAVETALSYGTSLLKPGVSFADCEGKVRECVGRQLYELGLITSANDKDGIRQYYPHSPHYLGLNVHDVGDYTMPLEPGMTLTLEPGIYIPEEGIGVRIEDDILITEQGCEVLSAQLPRSQF